MSKKKGRWKQINEHSEWEKTSNGQFWGIFASLCKAYLNQFEVDILSWKNNFQMILNNRNGIMYKNHLNAFYLHLSLDSGWTVLFNIKIFVHFVHFTKTLKWPKKRSGQREERWLLMLCPCTFDGTKTCSVTYLILF